MSRPLVLRTVTFTPVLRKLSTKRFTERSVGASSEDSGVGLSGMTFTWAAMPWAIAPNLSAWSRESCLSAISVHSIETRRPVFWKKAAQAAVRAALG